MTRANTTAGSRARGATDSDESPDTTHDRATVLRVAADLECDPRTAAKLLAGGADAARNVALRERARRYFAKVAR